MTISTEFGKIETLYERNEKFKVNVGQFKNRTYTLLKSWLWTEKVDGTNMRIIWQDKKLSFGGKTDTAQIPGDLLGQLYKDFTASMLESIFPDADAVIYGEGYGAGIQKGGGDYCPSKAFIAFDVCVITPPTDLVAGVTAPEGKWWLSYENVCDVAGKLKIPVVPFIGEMTLEDATEFVHAGFKSRCAVNPNKMAEGLVGRPLETLYDKKGARLITKLKTKDF